MTSSVPTRALTAEELAALDYATHFAVRSMTSGSVFAAPREYFAGCAMLQGALEDEELREPFEVNIDAPVLERVMAFLLEFTKNPYARWTAPVAPNWWDTVDERVRHFVRKHLEDASEAPATPALPLVWSMRVLCAAGVLDNSALRNLCAANIAFALLREAKAVYPASVPAAVAERRCTDRVRALLAMPETPNPSDFLLPRAASSEAGGLGMTSDSRAVCHSIGVVFSHCPSSDVFRRVAELETAVEAAAAEEH